MRWSVVALREGNAVWRIDMKSRTLHRLAGTGKKGFTGNDGPATAALLNGPKGLSVAPSGDVYIADTESHSIRYVDHATGKIRVLAHFHAIGKRDGQNLFGQRALSRGGDDGRGAIGLFLQSDGNGPPRGRRVLPRVFGGAAGGGGRRRHGAFSKTG